MIRMLMVSALMVPMFAAPTLTLAQAPVTAAADEDSTRVLRQSLSGPRFGFTVFTGAVAELRNRAGLEPIMTQFGWQFEKRIMAQEDGGNEALLEWVFLVGGMEQSELNLTLSWLAGFRTASGLELGAGPAISANKDSRKLNTSMIAAIGAAPPFGSMRIPIHMAVGMSNGGPRITTLIGWIVRS